MEDSKELIRYIADNFEKGERLQAARADTDIRYSGMGTYTGGGNYTHLRNVTVVIARSQGFSSTDKIKLFSEVLFHLVKGYGNPVDRETIESLDGKLKIFLRGKGASDNYPNLYTYEPYYAAMTRSIHNKIARKG